MSPVATVTRVSQGARRGLQRFLPDPPVASLRELTIGAFVRETGVTQALAAGFVDSIVEEVSDCANALVSPGKASGWHPDTSWLETYHHDIFAKAMVDDTPAAAGSAHARLQDLCGKTIGRPVKLTHTKARAHGLTHCLLHIEVTAS